MSPDMAQYTHKQIAKATKSIRDAILALREVPDCIIGPDVAQNTNDLVNTKERLMQLASECADYAKAK